MRCEALCAYAYLPPTPPLACSNPNPQELQQLLPCDEWTPHGFPAQGEAWVGDDSAWDLGVGDLGARLYLTGVEPDPLPGHVATVATRRDGPSSGWPGLNRSWISFEVGPEQADGAGNQPMTRWEVSDWDVLA